MGQKILVIKLSALGDFIQAVSAFAAIRSHHNRDAIVLLTTEPFADFAARSPWFDEIWIDTKPKIYDLAGWLNLRTRLLGGGFNRVYDLQTSDRSCFYFNLFWPVKTPQWSGIVTGCSHRHSNPNRNLMHTIDRLAEQLTKAGVFSISEPDFSWVQGDISHFNLKSRYVILVPGGARHRPNKRWPVEHFKQLAEELQDKGFQIIVIGNSEEFRLADQIIGELPDGVNLAGQTSIEDLCLIARNAASVIGNDTGPMHVFSSLGCPSIVLFSNSSDPKLCAQRGKNVTILQRERLDTLDVEVVLKVISNR